MGIIIQLPYYPGEILKGEKYWRLQINRIKEILSIAKNKEYPIGIQIYMGGNDILIHHSDKYGPQEVFLRMRDAFGEEIWQNSSLHLPICPRIPEKRFRLGKQECFDVFSVILEKAKEYELKRILMHTNTIFYQPAPENLEDLTKAEFIWNEQKKEEAKGFLGIVLKLAERFPEHNFAYETMPFPIVEDSEVEPRKCTIEPNLITAKSLGDFLESTKERKNINLCLDVAHYIIAKETLDVLEKNPEWLKDGYLRILIGALWPEANIIPSYKNACEILRVLKMPSLTKFVRKHSSRITDVQIADTSGAWMPSIDGGEAVKVQEGAPLIPGKNFYDKIMECYRIIKKGATKREIAVSFDVEERDYRTRLNQERTLRQILDNEN